MLFITALKPPPSFINLSLLLRYLPVFPKNPITSLCLILRLCVGVWTCLRIRDKVSWSVFLIWLTRAWGLSLGMLPNLPWNCSEESNLLLVIEILELKNRSIVTIRTIDVSLKKREKGFNMKNMTHYWSKPITIRCFKTCRELLLVKVFWLSSLSFRVSYLWGRANFLLSNPGNLILKIIFHLYINGISIQLFT